MGYASREEVNEVFGKIHTISDNINLDSTFQNYQRIKEIIKELETVWNTVGSEKEIQTLKQLADEINASIVPRHFLSALKSATSSIQVQESPHIEKTSQSLNANMINQ